jgi:hypothetical protein
MHQYSINSSERDTIPFFIAAICIGLYFIIKHIPGLPSWVPVPTTFAIYGMGYKLFDLFIWRWCLLQKLRIIKTPDLNGKYKAVLKSSIDKFGAEYQGTLKIEQNWTTISLYLESKQASSISLMGNIQMVSSSVFKIEWEYRSEKKPEFKEQGKESIHYGLTRLTFNSATDDSLFKGDYFTEPNHDSYGSMEMSLIPEE